MLLAIILATITALVVKLSTKGVTSRSYKIISYLLSIGYYFYSGYGISLITDHRLKYSCMYVVFLFVLLFTMRIFALGCRKEAKQSINASYCMPLGKVDKTYRAMHGLFTFMAFTYLFNVFVSLIYPNFVLLAMLNPIKMLASFEMKLSVFGSRIERRNDSITQILYYARLLSTPFFYIWLNDRVHNWRYLLLASCIICYVEIAFNGEWGRADFLMPIVFVIVYRYTNKELSFNKIVIIMLFITTLFIPVFNWLGSWKYTQSAFNITGINFVNMINKFIKDEFYYPTLYPKCSEMSQVQNYSYKYLLWLVTLPIPSVLTGASFSFSREFSEYILGKAYGTGGFYILLPSFLGEAIIAFGDNLFWIGAIILGAEIGVIYKIISRNRCMRLLGVYYTWLVVYYTRSVGQELIAQTIQPLWLLLIIVFVYRLFDAKRRGVVKT